MKGRAPWPLLSFACVLSVGAWLRDPQPATAGAAVRETRSNVTSIGATASRDAGGLRDVAYGPHARQRYDVYAPVQTAGAPTIFFVHGGGWQRGDKRGAIGAKAGRWTAAGAFVVSTNYRLVPDADPVEQARDLGRALASAQAQVAKLGGDPNAFVLMGHSAGAHLVALLASSQALMRESGAKPIRGQVLLDSGAIDVEATMRQPGKDFLFDNVFGTDPELWKQASPMRQLSARTAPILAVCAEQRRASCPNNRAFLTKAQSFGTRTQLMPVALNHAQINRTLGEDNAYTRDVEAFIRGLGVRLRD